MQGLEVYSTVLWHLKREVDLSHLAQRAVELDRRSPHAWAIVGNCFSLQKVRMHVHACRTGRCLVLPASNLGMFTDCCKIIRSQQWTCILMRIVHP